MRRAGLPLLALLGMLTAACASAGTPVPQPFPRPGAQRGPASGAIAVDVVSTALALQGVPYRSGGSDPNGFDCSGFVAWVFGRHGLDVPRTVSEQTTLGRRVDARRLEPGDLVFFRISGRGASHVGIAIGDGEFVHAPSPRGHVRVERLDAAYWQRRFWGARRLDQIASPVIVAPNSYDR